MDQWPAWIEKTANSNNKMSFGAAWEGLDPQFPGREDYCYCWPSVQHKKKIKKVLSFAFQPD